MAKGDEKDTTLSSEDQKKDRERYRQLKDRPLGPKGRRLPARHGRTPDPSLPETPVDDLTLKQLEFLQNIHQEIKQKNWQLGKLGGMEVRVDNTTKLMPHNAARIYDLSSKADSHKLSEIPGLFMKVSQILAETQKEPWWKRVLDKLDFLNLFARSKDTSEFYKKSHDIFFKVETKSKPPEEPDNTHSSDSVKGLPP